MAENKYRVQDEDGIVQVETLIDGLKLIQADPDKLGFIVENSSGKVVTIWMRDSMGVGDVWIWYHSPEFKREVEFYLDEIEQQARDHTGLTKAQREEVEKMLTGRGAEKIYERFVEEVYDFTFNNVSYPEGGEEDEVAEALQTYAWEVFKKEFLSDKVVPGTISVEAL